MKYDLISVGMALVDSIIKGFNPNPVSLRGLWPDPPLAAFNTVYAEYFVSKPARSCVAVRELPKGALCEIEAIAVLP